MQRRPLLTSPPQALRSEIECARCRRFQGSRKGFLMRSYPGRLNQPIVWCCFTLLLGGASELSAQWSENDIQLAGRYKNWTLAADDPYAPDKAIGASCLAF